jgi:hypothetical protein
LITFLLLTLYSFSTTQVLSTKEHLALIWKHDKDKIILYVFPMNICALVEKHGMYIYLDDSLETYVSALHINNNEKSVRKIVNHKYLIAWNHELPIIKTFPKHLTKIIDVVNYLSTHSL